jgi:aspartate racemase
MKTIGLIAGMSWESSLEYYRIINETANQKLGSLHSARVLMYSFDFEDIQKLQHEQRWDEATKLIIIAARKLEQAGADFLVMCTNTMHKVAPTVEKSVNIPLLHIADSTAEQIKADALKKVGLLGTRFTMEDDFYKERLTAKHAIEVIIPNDADRKIVHDIIYHELCIGETKQTSKERLKRIIEDLVAEGAKGIILGCTELSLLIKQEDANVPIFDSTTIHATAAVEFALRQ